MACVPGLNFPHCLVFCDTYRVDQLLTDFQHVVFPACVHHLASSMEVLLSPNICERLSFRYYLMFYDLGVGEEVFFALYIILF